MNDHPKPEQISLRLPDGWRRQIKIAAAENGRTMNAEIVQRLRASIEGANDNRRTA